MGAPILDGIVILAGTLMASVSSCVLVFRFCSFLMCVCVCVCACVCVCVSVYACIMFFHPVILSCSLRLSKPVKRRVRALKSLQYDFTKLEAEFYKEVQQLEAKYAAKYQPLFDKVRHMPCTYRNLPIKRPWALEIHGPKNGGGRLHGESICTYNAYTHGP